MSCDSALAGNGFYWLVCDGASAAANVRSSIRAYYAAFDAVAEVEVDVTRLDAARQVIDTGVVFEAMRQALQLAGPVGSPAYNWLDDSSCTGYPSCMNDFAGAAVMVRWRSGEDQSVIIYPSFTDRSPLASTPAASPLALADATPPPGATVIPRLRLDAIVAIATSLGLACTSGPYSPPVGPADGSHVLVCGGDDPRINANTTVSARYWGLGGVEGLAVELSPMDYAIPIVDPTAPVRVLQPFAALVGGDAARSWISEIDAPACEDCFTTIAGVQFEAQAGYGGTRTLRIGVAFA